MTDPYSTFDTFTVGSESEPTPPEPSSMPPLIARLPKIAPAPPQRETRQRFDKPESIRPESHLNDSTWEQYATRTDTSTTTGPRPAITGDPTATIRIDTVSPGMFDDRPLIESTENTLGEAKLGDVGPATIPFEPLPSKSPTTTATAIDEPWTAWMLDIESTIQPYSRWIALAAVIAAMGLTVVLLRGSGRVQMMETTDTSPRVSIDAASTQGLAGDYETEGAPPFWPTGVAEEAIDAGPTNNLPTYASQGGGLRPLDSTVAAATPPPVAAGPASAARASGGAQFTGQIMPSDSQRIDVADAKYNTANPGSLR